jgi:hypothetical protein
MTLTLAATAATLVWLAGYVAACMFWPFAACTRCTGSGKRRSPSGKAWRPCRRCKGSGSRLRFGRKVGNYLARTGGDAR